MFSTTFGSAIEVEWLLSIEINWIEILMLPQPSWVALRRMENNKKVKSLRLAKTNMIEEASAACLCRWNFNFVCFRSSWGERKRKAELRTPGEAFESWWNKTDGKREMVEIFYESFRKVSHRNSSTPAMHIKHLQSLLASSSMSSLCVLPASEMLEWKERK
jgi:hypothetical protein